MRRGNHLSELCRSFSSSEFSSILTLSTCFCVEKIFVSEQISKEHSHLKRSGRTRTRNLKNLYRNDAKSVFVTSATHRATFSVERRACALG